MDKHQLGVRLTHQSYCMIQLFLRLLGWFTSCLPRDPCFEKTSSPTHLPNVSNCGDWQNDSPCPWGRAVFNVLSAYIIVLCIVQFCPGGELFDYIVAKERLKVWFSSRAYQVTYSEHAMCIKKAEVVIIFQFTFIVNQGHLDECLECVLAFITMYYWKVKP